MASRYFWVELVLSMVCQDLKFQAMAVQDMEKVTTTTVAVSSKPVFSINTRGLYHSCLIILLPSYWSYLITSLFPATACVVLFSAIFIVFFNGICKNFCKKASYINKYLIILYNFFFKHLICCKKFTTLFIAGIFICLFYFVQD